MARIDDLNRLTPKQLAELFSTSVQTVRKRIRGIPPVETSGPAKFYTLASVAELIDVREPYQHEEAHEETIETDPNKMKPSDRRTHYQAEDLKQASEIKLRKNMEENGQLIPAGEVEQTLAVAFKDIALVLETLPDMLERDGLVSSGDLEQVIDIIDRGREQLAHRMSELSPEVGHINESGDWLPGLKPDEDTTDDE